MRAQTREPAATPPSGAAPASGRELPTWPLVSLLAGYPIWWALGFGTFVVPLLAVPMLWLLIRSRSVRVPPGFGWWAAFLLWTVLSLVMLGYTPPGTLEDGVLGRGAVAIFRISLYVGLTVILVYATSLPRHLLTSGRLVWLLGLVFVYTAAGGLVGVLWPTLEFTAPLELVLPGALRENSWVASMVHPSSAQVQDFLGFDVGRPAAPFGFTNKWGAAYALLVPWFLVAWMLWKRGASRGLAAALLVLSLVPVIQSVNRGLWLALVLMTALVLLRLALRGYLLAAGIALSGVLLVTGMLIATPLGDYVSGRFENQHSNSIREFSTVKALEASTYSPILGYGTTRRAEGSARSIAVGRSEACPTCGNTPLGQNGHVFLVLISQGWVGIVLFYGMFVRGIIRWWRRTDPVGMAGVLALISGLVLTLYYDMLVTSLLFWLLAIAVLFKSESESLGHGAGAAPKERAS